MDIKILNQTAIQMVANSKGILALDESHGTIQKRFDSLGIEVNEENRRSYRDMLLKTNSLSNYISGAILFDETIRQKTTEGKSFPKYLNEIGIIPGIKVDTGAKPFSCHKNEKITEGLDNLPQRMDEYSNLGAKFAKWRAVITIGEDIPSSACMVANAHALARYASICQAVDVVPMIEPEVLMDGSHDINKCFEVTNITQSILFEALDKLNVNFSGIILKPNMVTSGSSCKTQSSAEEIKEFNNGNYINYGVREFGMSAIMNGISSHNGFIPYGGTFLTFCDYSKNAIRMSAIMGLKNIYVFTHDSIGLGEDGPTHQAIEQINSLRDIPNNTVIRPCDTLETAIAWKYAIENDAGPTCLILSRQNCEFQNRTSEQIALINRGAYILKDSKNLDLILIATGSEVGITMNAAIELEHKGINVRVISMLSTDIFDSQEQEYKEEILPSSIVNRISIEAGSTSHWYKYIGLKGKAIGINSFGESAPGGELLKYFGFTSQNIVEHAEVMLKKNKYRK